MEPTKALVTYTRLKSFLEQKYFSPDDIVNWVSDCVAFFTELKVNEAVISGFIRTFELSNITEERGGFPWKHEYLGPFHRFGSGGTYTYERGDDTDNRIQTHRVAINIAMRTAMSIIDSAIEEKRLISSALIECFKTDPKYSHILSSLEQLETCHKSKDSEGIARNSITLLDSILGLDSTLMSLDLGQKLKKLMSEIPLQEKFGVRKEVCYALDNSRILRNYLTTHKNIPIEYNFSFAASVGIAYLVVMFLQITMATGVLLTK